MRTVRDGSGDRYLLLKESGDASLVRDPETGETRYVDDEDLSPVEGESPLTTAAASVPEPTRRLLTAVRDEQSLGLLVELAARGPMAVRTVLGEYDLCESDVHGILAEFRAAGLVVETTIAGERGYEVTDAGRTALEAVTSADEEVLASGADVHGETPTGESGKGPAGGDDGR